MPENSNCCQQIWHCDGNGKVTVPGGKHIGQVRPHPHRGFVWFAITPDGRELKARTLGRACELLLAEHEKHDA